MIINIRGTHGSGKSYIVHQILKRFPNYAITDPKGKVLAYEVILKRKKLYIIGPYKTACGGCDAIQPYALIWPRVLEYARLGYVLFEGALVSSSVGNIGRAMAERKDCVLAFMNTPLQTCLDRIAARRKARGDLRPLNPHNTTVKFEGILRSRPQLESLGLRCVDVPHKRGVLCILNLLGVKNED